MSYISREAEIENIKTISAMQGGVISDFAAISAILSIPSADVVEVIRCKDCKHYEIWQLKSDYTDDKRYKPSVCVIGRYAVHRSEDWFCADAERRTDE